MSTAAGREDSTGADALRQRALVAQTRVPEIDRDSGSQQVDLYVRWLLEDGWAVSFLAGDEAGDAHQAHRLRQLGVATYTRFEEAEELVAAGSFELAVLAFWEPASRLLPVIRRSSPQTRVIVDSVDLHFLRDARRLFGAGVRLDERYGARCAEELNTYRSADAVLTVSQREADLIADFVGAREPTSFRSPSRSPAPWSRSTSGAGCSSSATSATCPTARRSSTSVTRSSRGSIRSSSGSIPCR